MRLALACALGLCALGALSAGAFAAVPYQFNEPTVRAIGDEETIFDAYNPDTGQLVNQCSNEGPSPGNIGDSDIPDVPARAYRSNGQIVLFSSHFTTRRFVGPNFNSLAHPCDVVMQSAGMSGSPSAFHDHEWLNSFWTTDGSKVYALVHEEYQGWREDAVNCQKDLNGDGTVDFDDMQRCWRNSITLATSTDGGAHFTATGCAEPPPATCNLVAGSPYKFNSSPAIGPYGYFNPSNMVGSPDGNWLYAIIRSIGTSGTPDQKDGACLIRVANNDASLSDAKAWQAWTGTGFSSVFVNPYTETATPEANHVCAPVDPDIFTMSGSLTYSEYFQKYVLVDRGTSPSPGVYFATSPDLINWSKPTLLMKAEVPPLSSNDCVPPQPIRLPSLIDPSRGRPNFDTIGRSPYLYYTRANMEDNGDGTCSLGLDRDLVRVKIEFDSSTPPPENPPDGGGDDGGSDEPPADTKAAKVSISSGKKQDIDKLAITIRLDEDAIVQATATVNVSGASKLYSFKRVRKEVTANKRVKLRLKLSSKNLKKVKRALRRGKKLTAKVKVTATDVGGNNSSKRSSIKLKP